MDEARSTSPEGRADARPATPVAVLLMAAWLGLVAGYVDVGEVVLKRFALNPEGSYRTARDFLWTVPLGHVALMLPPAAVLALVTWRWPRRSSLRACSWLLATLASWFALLRLPLHLLSTLVLAAGIGRLFSDLVAARGFGPRVGWVRRSLAGLACLLVLGFAGTTGRRMIGESRAVASLPAASASAPNVVLIVWDTVRSTSLGLQGYARETTPNLARWAAKGVRYGKALAPSPWTYPSHATFFTGYWPFQIDAQWKPALDTPHRTLAEYLSSRGYQTAGFVGNTNSCNYETGLDRGFVHYDDYALTPRALLTRTVPGKWVLERLLLYVDPYERKWATLQASGAEGINASFLGWLDRRRADRPFFAFLNLFDAHEPYVPPARFAGRFGIAPRGAGDYRTLFDYIGAIKGDLTPRDYTLVRDCYESCIAFLDEQFGRLMDALQGRGLLENTIVVLTADHGEGFGEHNIWGHAHAVEIQEVGVPLVILAPGAPSGRAEGTAVSLRDLPATLMDLLGLGEGSPFPGRSLAAYWRVPAGRALDPPSSPALSEKADATAFPSPGGKPPNRGGFEMSLVAPFGYQYIRNGEGKEMVFHLWRDAWAQRNLIGTPEGDAMAGRLRAMLLQALTDDRASPAVEDAYMREYRRGLADLVNHAAPAPTGPPSRDAAGPPPTQPAE
ncbi:Arylsulfatase [Aquisphaera giovannonii]|uniref:Arylsulfatase n=1 Tax=Aquisphaera giovannonii TaxID=406548 RepID=A0A5B9WEN5_9BACT|nr:sulfatase [Aquisphaera giovannonii]QEH39042.1 Arylsulfatase [Aquisphaera giovannonii]